MRRRQLSMSQEQSPSGPFRWILWGIFLTALNGCWSQVVNFEDARRKGQSVFSPSAPILPEWVFYTVYGLLLLQLLVSAIGVVRTGSWWLAAILIVLMSVAVIVAQTTYG